MFGHEYAFVNARVGGMKWHLIDDTEMKSLMESRNFDDAFALLKNSAYGKELSKLSSPNATEIENTLSSSVAVDYRKLVTSVNGTARNFLAHYAKRLEIDSLKMLFVMKSKGEDVKRYPWIARGLKAAPMSEKLVEAGTVEEMVEMLRFTKYHPALHKAASEYEEHGTAYSFITALDSYYYVGLKKILKGVGGSDKAMINRLLGIEIDSKNLLTALRIRGTEIKDIMEWMIPIKYKLTESELTAAFSVGNISELPQVLQHYTDIVSEGVKEYERTNSLFALEQEFNRYILKENNRIFIGFRFHIGVPIAYLKLKENEVRNLTTILHGTEEGMDSSKIEEIAILLNS